MTSVRNISALIFILAFISLGSCDQGDADCQPGVDCPEAMVDAQIQATFPPPTFPPPTFPPTGFFQPLFRNFEDIPFQELEELDDGDFTDDNTQLVNDGQDITDSQNMMGGEDDTNSEVNDEQEDSNTGTKDERNDANTQMNDVDNDDNTPQGNEGKKGEEEEASDEPKDQDKDGSAPKDLRAETETESEPSAKTVEKQEKTSSKRVERSAKGR